MSILRKQLLNLWLAGATLVVVFVTNITRFGNAEVRYRAARWVSRWWSRGMLSITGAQYKVEGLEHINGRGPYIIMSNHRSHVDTPLLIEGLPFLFGFIVKEELMKIPIFAAGMRGIGCVAVSRGGGKKDYDVLDDVAREVAGGKNILIFPEGTRSPTENFLPFKKGGAVLAIKAGVPVLPVAVSGTDRILPVGDTAITPGKLLLRIGKPIPTKELDLGSRDKLIQEVRASIEALYEPGYGLEP